MNGQVAFAKRVSKTTAYFSSGSNIVFILMAVGIVILAASGLYRFYWLTRRVIPSSITDYYPRPAEQNRQVKETAEDPMASDAIDSAE